MTQSNLFHVAHTHCSRLGTRELSRCLLDAISTIWKTESTAPLLVKQHPVLPRAAAAERLLFCNSHVSRLDKSNGVYFSGFAHL